MTFRVAVVPSTGELGASARYRALQHVQRIGRTCDVEVLLPATGPPAGILAGPTARARFFGGQGVRYVRRAADLARVLRRYDAILVQRGVYPLGPGAAVAPIEAFDGRVVFDLDDDVFTPSTTLSSRGRGARWLYGPQQARRLVRRADAVVVSTDALAAALPATRGRVTVLPTVPDPARHEVRVHEDRSPAIIGWVGNAGNLPHLDVIASTVEHLARDGVAELEVVSSRPWRQDVRFHPWSLAGETTDLLRFDIGVMPLLDTPYAQAKAGFKLLQYMAAGLPVVASPIGVNTMLIEQSGAGAVAASPADWDRELRRFATDAALRAEAGARGRAWIEHYADLDRQASTLAGLLGVPSCAS